MIKRPSASTPSLAASTGFTLLEVLVALVIFSTAVLVLMQQNGRALQHQAYLEEKTLEVWIAENQLALLRITEPWPQTGARTLEKHLSQREWQVDQTIEETQQPALRKVTIVVSRKNASSPTHSLTGYLGEH